jgi:hypothetical protein
LGGFDKRKTKNEQAAFVDCTICLRSFESGGTDERRSGILVERNDVLVSKTRTDDGASPNPALAPNRWCERPGNRSVSTTNVSWFSSTCLRGWPFVATTSVRSGQQRMATFSQQDVENVQLRE